MKDFSIALRPSKRTFKGMMITFVGCLGGGRGLGNKGRVKDQQRWGLKRAASVRLVLFRGNRKCIVFVELLCLEFPKATSCSFGTAPPGIS